MSGFRHSHQSSNDIYLGAYGEWDLYTDSDCLYLLANKGVEEFVCRAKYGLDPEVWPNEETFEAMSECRHFYDLRFNQADPSVSPNCGK